MTSSKIDSIHRGIYPLTRRDDRVVDDFGGTKVTDHYRWLEDPDFGVTQAWVQQLGVISTQFVSEAGEKLQEKPKKLWDLEKYGNVLAYDISRKGSDWVTNKSTEIVEEEISDTINVDKFVNIAWTIANNGVFYARYPEHKNAFEDSPVEKHECYSLYYHKMGPDCKKDLLVEDSRENSNFMVSENVIEEGSLPRIEFLKGCDPRASKNQISGKFELKSLFDKIDDKYDAFETIGYECEIIDILPILDEHCGITCLKSECGESLLMDTLNGNSLSSVPSEAELYGKSLISVLASSSNRLIRGYFTILLFCMLLSNGLCMNYTDISYTDCAFHNPDDHMRVIRSLFGDPQSREQTRDIVFIEIGEGKPNEQQFIQKYTCTGVIIGRKYITTSSHCFYYLIKDEGYPVARICAAEVDANVFKARHYESCVYVQTSPNNLWMFKGFPPPEDLDTMTNPLVVTDATVIRIPELKDFCRLNLKTKKPGPAMARAPLDDDFNLVMPEIDKENETVYILDWGQTTALEPPVERKLRQVLYVGLWPSTYKHLNLSTVWGTYVKVVKKPDGTEIRPQAYCGSSGGAVQIMRKGKRITIGTINGLPRAPKELDKFPQKQLEYFMDNARMLFFTSWLNPDVVKFYRDTITADGGMPGWKFDRIHACRNDI